MKRCSRITICDGEVVTFAEGFEMRDGILGPFYEAIGPYEISVSRNQVMVHRATLMDGTQCAAAAHAIRECAAIMPLLEAGAMRFPREPVEVPS